MGGSLRIWYQSTTELAACPQYAHSLRHHFAETFPDGDVVVDLFGVPAGTWAGLAPSAYIASPMSYVRMLSASLFENVVTAEERGYDAFVIGSYTEPFLRECRSLVDIPVVAVTESSLLVACSFAKTFALVTLNDENVWFLKNAVERHGLGGRVSGIYPVRHVMDELDINALFSDPLPYAAEFTEVARIAVEAFADLIVPAEGLVAELVHNVGVTEVGSVCVLDGIGAPLQHAAMLARLRRTSGIHPGRRWHYVRAPDRLRDEFRGPGASNEHDRTEDVHP
jgi:allantoin racemase